MLLVGPERAREVFDAAHPDANFLEHFAGFSDVTAVSNVMHEHLASRSDQRVGLEAVIGMMTPEEKAEYIKKLTKKNIEFLRLNVDHTIDPTQEALSPAQRGREKFQRAARQAARLGVRASAEGEERIALTPAYVREALDPQHVYGKASMFHEWLESEDNNLSFAEWRQGKIKNSEVHRLRALEVGVTYLSAEEREGHRAEFTRDGRLNITTKDLAHVDMGQGWGLFVLDAEQNLFVGQHDRGTFQHSSFFSGEPIWGAGMVRINESGRITGINMHSGHYRPSGEDTYRTLKFFEAQGIDLSFVSFEFNTQGRRIRGLASIILTRLEAKYGS